MKSGNIALFLYLRLDFTFFIEYNISIEKEKNI